MDSSFFLLMMAFSAWGLILKHSLTLLSFSSLSLSLSGSASELTTLPEFTFSELKDATGGFAELNLLGEGGYAKVYKGSQKFGGQVRHIRFHAIYIASIKISRHYHLLYCPRALQ